VTRFAILAPVTESSDRASKSLDALCRQSLNDWTCHVFDESADHRSAADALIAAVKDPRFSKAPAECNTLARMINWGIKNTQADFLIPLAEGIVLKPDALAKFAAHLDSRPNAAAAYSCFTEVAADGARKDVKTYPHEGAPHERFEFGFLKVYRAAHLKEVGGFRDDLVHAAEYDIELKLCDKHALELVDECLYDALLPASAAAESKAGSLHSPGKGKLGGFSYVFYPPDLEKEITGVFEEMLHRRGAWIDHDTVPVAYPTEPYPLLASVVVPVLNRARFVGNAIERVLEGTFKEFEVLIIDNGSTDGTQAVVEEYAKKDPRVRLLTGTGNCIASALNDGIRAARGKYICQLDSDDEYKPDTLEKMVAHMESHPKCGLAISYYELMNEDRSEVTEVAPVTHSGYTRNQILRRDGAGALRVFPKAVLMEMGLYDEENYGNFGEDYDMVLKVGEKYDVDRVHHVLYRYRRHADNTDVTRDPLMKIRNKNNARLNALRRRGEINRRIGKAS
jgi:GT2 family glycosyltransferase